MTTLPQNETLIAGWHEEVSFPDLGIEVAYAKFDTGADGSVLHARDIGILKQHDGQRLVEFTAPLLRRQESCESFPAGGVRRVRARLIEECTIRSSNGQDERRVLVATSVQLGPYTFEAEVSLTSREGLRFPVLIGRDILAGRFLVDSAHAHLLSSGGCSYV